LTEIVAEFDFYPEVHHNNIDGKNENKYIKKKQKNTNHLYQLFNKYVYLCIIVLNKKEAISVSVPKCFDVSRYIYI